MVADCLDIDGVKSSPVHEVRFTKSGSFSLGAVIQLWVPSMHQGIQLAVKTSCLSTTLIAGQVALKKV